jgi:hypothetical protein
MLIKEISSRKDDRISLENPATVSPSAGTLGRIVMAQIGGNNTC